MMNNYKVENSGGGHTIVKQFVPGQFFPSIACSVCEIISDHFPSFRPENPCTVCANASSVYEVCGFGVCGSCYIDHCAWLEMNPGYPALDFFVNKVTS